MAVQSGLLGMGQRKEANCRKNIKVFMKWAFQKRSEAFSRLKGKLTKLLINLNVLGRDGLNLKDLVDK